MRLSSRNTTSLEVDSVETTRPVSVSVHDIVCMMCMLMRVVHVKAHLLDYVGDVRHGEGEVLEILDQATVSSRVIDRGTRIGGEHSSSAHHHGARLVFALASLLKDILGILALV
jgi:hypothetical protein